MKGGAKLRARSANKNGIEKEVDLLCIKQFSRDRGDWGLLNEFSIFRDLSPCLAVIKAGSSLIVPIPDPPPDSRRFNMLIETFF